MCVLCSTISPVFPAGFPTNLEIRNTWKKSFHFSSQGKIREFENMFKIVQKSWNLFDP